MSVSPSDRRIPRKPWLIAAISNSRSQVPDTRRAARAGADLSRRWPNHPNIAKSVLFLLPPGKSSDHTTAAFLLFRLYKS
jgi:hypothetical protein